MDCVVDRVVLSGDGLAFGLGSMTERQWKLFTDTMASEGLYPRALDFRRAYEAFAAKRQPVFEGN